MLFFLLSFLLSENHCISFCMYKWILTGCWLHDELLFFTNFSQYQMHTYYWHNQEYAYKYIQQITFHNEYGILIWRMLFQNKTIGGKEKLGKFSAKACKLESRIDEEIDR